VVSVTDPYGRIVGFLYRSRYFFFQVAPQLSEDSYNILNKCKPRFSGFLNVHSVSDVRQKYINLNHQYVILFPLRLKLLLRS
jgi:hypothetical protein